MGFLDLFRRRNTDDPDELVLIQLRKAGSDLQKPHDIEFFLYFPTQSNAETAAAAIQENGFRVKVEPSAMSEEWLCYATKRMVPSLSALQQIRRDFNRIAQPLGGNYDGWGTEVAK